MGAARLAARFPVLLLLLAAAALPVRADDTATPEQVQASRQGLDTAADSLWRLRTRLGSNDKHERRELLDRARRLHDKAMAIADDPQAAGKLVQQMDALHVELSEFFDRAGEAPGAMVEPSTRHDAPAANPMDRDPSDIPPVVAITTYNDVRGDALDVKSRLSATENARVAELIAEGDRVVHEIRQTAQRKHVDRADKVARLREIQGELHDIYETGITSRRKGIPMVRADLAAGNWTTVGQTQGPFTVMRTRFLRPGSAYVTVRNDGDAPRAFGIDLSFSDVVGDPTGEASWTSRDREELRAGEVREVLVQIQPSVNRFWDVTTDYTVTVQ
jgi:hypothetical protein